MPGIDLFSTYTMLALIEQINTPPTFFRDRYFPTGAEDIFDSDKVLVEYEKDGTTIAPFVSDRVGDIPVDRSSYSVSEYFPANIAPSRILTADELKKRGFGEALFAGASQAERAARIQMKDLRQLGDMITRREEWMAVQTMLNNACTIQEYIDADTLGAPKHINFYDKDPAEHKYSIAKPWNNGGNFFGDVKAMCKLLAERGVQPQDLVLGSDVADEILNIERVQTLLDKNSGIITGEIAEKLTGYTGVAFMGKINFGGYKLNLFSCDTTYTDEKGVMQKYFPTNAAMVTAPAIGSMKYANVAQIEFGKTDFEIYTGSRIPRLEIKNNTRKLVLTSRPLATPKYYAPFCVAENVIA